MYQHGEPLTWPLNLARFQNKPGEKWLKWANQLGKYTLQLVDSAKTQFDS